MNVVLELKGLEEFLVAEVAVFGVQVYVQRSPCLVECPDQCCHVALLFSRRHKAVPHAFLCRHAVVHLQVCAPMSEMELRRVGLVCFYGVVDKLS